MRGGRRRRRNQSNDIAAAFFCYSSSYYYYYSYCSYYSVKAIRKELDFDLFVAVRCRSRSGCHVRLALQRTTKSPTPGRMLHGVHHSGRGRQDVEPGHGLLRRLFTGLVQQASNGVHSHVAVANQQWLMCSITGHSVSIAPPTLYCLRRMPTTGVGQQTQYVSNRSSAAYLLTKLASKLPPRRVYSIMLIHFYTYYMQEKVPHPLPNASLGHRAQSYSDKSLSKVQLVQNCHPPGGRGSFQHCKYARYWWLALQPLNKLPSQQLLR